jgi:hypothetical protein
MKFFVPIGMVAVFCFIILTGCAGTTPQPPRSIITFDYTPPSEADTGGAGVTFAVVGARPINPNQQGVAQLVHQTPVPMFAEFIDNMTKDFIEVLVARGYGVRGPFKSYEDMIHPEKEGSDLVLTAEVDFSLDGSGVRYSYQTNVTKSDGFELKGPVKVQSHVNLLVYESLTNTKMWTKSIAIEPLTVNLQSHDDYPMSTLVTFAAKYGKMAGESVPREGDGIPFGIPVTAFLAHENLFYSEVGRVLQVQYADILKGIYSYLDPREMDMVKNQSLELRKKKVY